MGSDDGGELALSRRNVLLGVGGVGALTLGGAGAYTALSDREAQPRTYILQQGYLRWEVTPFSQDDTTVEEFYGYRNGTAHPEASLVGEESAASRLFLYAGPVGTSLGFLHGGRAAEEGGTAFLAFSGLSRSKGEWAVRDDPMGTDDDFEKWEGGNAKVKWEWDAGETDGGAFWGGFDREDFTVSITPKTLQGVDTWQFLTGETGDIRRIDLYPGKPAKLKPTKGKKSVKRANVEIMPGTDPNEFDPYAKEMLTVALKSPPEDAGGEWVDPGAVDPGNYAVNFGSRSYLAGQNAAQPQKYFRQDGDLYLQYKTKAANFTLDSAYGFLVGKTGSYTWFRGADTVRPGGFNNVESPDPRLVVTDLNADPEGGDRQHLAAEYVQFTNDGEEALDMTDYTVRDEEGWAFHMPDGFTLDPGDEFRLHTGEGTWTETDLYWDVDYPVWDNDGDTVIVLDETDERVLEYAYPGR